MQLIPVIIAILLGTSVFLTIIEGIFIIRFSKVFFKTGIVIFKKQILLPEQTFINYDKKKIIGNKGVFLFNKERIYFRLRRSSFESYTPFPLKSIATIEDKGQLKIVSRLPIGSTALFGLIIIIWTLASIAFTITPVTNKIFGIGFGLFGLIFFGGMFFVSMPIEKERTKAMIEELKQILKEVSI